MTFKAIERRGLQLSMWMLGCIAMSAYAQDSTEMTPVSGEACAALVANSDRLSCYDGLFKAPTAEPLVSERTAAKDLATEPTKLKDKVVDRLEDLVPTAAAQLQPSHSLLDQRWELSATSKLGTWNLREYQPVYLLPAFWTSEKNQRPSSPNPNNSVKVGEEQHLDSLESKFQISFKTKAVENLFGDNGDLWLGYTQSSRWQVYNEEESRPFRETNYEPEASLIFRTNYEVLGLSGRMLGLTFNHQSNGRSDPISRSWNRVMLQVGLERDNFALMLRPWYRIPESSKDDNNADINDYVGRGDVTAFYRWQDHDFSVMLRHSLKGGDDSRGAVQFDWAFPITGKLRGHFQVFDGYGESLIDYNHRATYAGLGVSLLNWF